MGCPFLEQKGIEPIVKELSGGQFQPPVRKLVASIIFDEGENANRFPYPWEGVSFFGAEGNRTVGEVNDCFAK